MVKKDSSKFNQTLFNKASYRLQEHLKKHTGGINKLINIILNNYAVKSKQKTVELEIDKEIEELKSILYSGNLQKIPVLATRHVESLAMRICEALRQVNINSEVIYSEPKSGFDDETLYFVLCPQMFDSLPKLYFAFQLEQTINPRWMTDNYIEKLKGAIAIADYSLNNVGYLQDKGIELKNIFYIPIRPVHIKKTRSEFKYDVIFYGDDNCPRRQSILTELKKHFSVKVCKEIFGQELHEELKYAKVAINIHYYDKALLESVRLSELIENGKLIVSERGIEKCENEAFEKLVSFVDADDIDGLVYHIKKLLDGDAENSLVNDYSDEYCNEFLYGLYRLLLAFDIVSFEQFYEIIGKKIEIKNVTALSLKESRLRNEMFKASYPEIFMFSGLRHYVSWKGCGLSYKFLMRRAYDEGLENIAICEDDVWLPSNWENSLAQIKSYLNNRNWDIFFGLIADVHPETKIFSSEKTDLGELVCLDKPVSLVFCLYNKTAYSKIFTWDHHLNGMGNTIDRYIQRNGTLTSYCLYPYFVKLKSAKSTLWKDVANDVYNNIIVKSEKELQEKLLQYKKYIGR